MSEMTTMNNFMGTKNISGHKVISAKNNIRSLAMLPLAGTKEVPNVA
jgi:hypothetical protein